MKKVITATALAVFFFNSTIAQTMPNQPSVQTLKQSAKHNNKKQKKQKQHALNQLNLTDAQKVQLKAQKENYKAQMAAIKANDNVTVKEQNEKIAALKATNKQQKLSVLTAEQKATLAIIKTANKEAKKAKQTAKKAKHLNKLTQTLALTPTQLNDLKVRKLASEQRAIAIKANKTLSHEDKNLQLKTLHNESKNDLKSVLNNQQHAKLEAMKKEKVTKQKVK